MQPRHERKEGNSGEQLCSPRIVTARLKVDKKK